MKYRIRCFDEHGTVVFDRWELTRREAVMLYWEREDHKVQMLAGRKELVAQRS